MQLHRLEDTLSPSSTFPALIEHEIKKRVWSFLVVQDSYLISFKSTYSISLFHAKSPPPANCSEIPDESFEGNGGFQAHSLSTPTPTSYMLLQLKLTSIKRALFDATCPRYGRVLSLDEHYQSVQEADEQMNTLRRELPDWIKSSNGPDQFSSKMARDQWRAFRILYAHMKLSLHRTFFCLSFTKKEYCYSRIACMEAAHMILQTYIDTASGNNVVDIWTIPANVISSCITLTLNMLLTEAEDGLDMHHSRSMSEDRLSISRGLELLSTSAPSNQLVKRGVILVKRLLDPDCRRNMSLSHTSFRTDEVVRLVGEVERLMQSEYDDGLMAVLNLTFDELLELFVNQSPFPLGA